ncbi:MAG: glycoside hydrolase family 2 protein [Firmicutes bacterium]|nr:glycoside hydrolase family 2 protein [Bacillota bacterium]
MIQTKFNDGWKFWVETRSFALVWDIPAHARDVTLPHDAMIENAPREDSPNRTNTGFRDGGIYHYVKMMHVPWEYRDKTVVLKFEGVYMNAFVYINGQLAAKSPFGYSNIFVPMNDFLKYGEDNEIRVIVRNGAMTNSRWYSGGGIYRDVYLMVSDLVHITEEGVQITTESVSDDYAVINVATELKNRSHAAEELILQTNILDDTGNTVATEKSRLVLFQNEKRVLQQRILVDRAKLWSAETPHLYKCASRLSKVNEDGSTLDESRTTFGIRTLELDAKQGLRVNGKTVKLRGACIHHDSGLLGAATFEDAQYRQISMLKKAGFNAVRMAHHPMAPAMLRVCDEIGMYVMDETFDIWVRAKSGYDYSLNFHEWWEKDVTAMVKKDYNHPSVVMYSVGNEIPEIATKQGSQICHMISEKIKSLDPTRFTLASINGPFTLGDAVEKVIKDVVSDLTKQGKIDGSVNDLMTLMRAHMDDIVKHEEITKRLELACAPTDIAGYNYMTARHEADGRTYPNRVIVGAETFPPQIAENWDIVKRCGHVIGDFTWTGWDYIGEAGVGVPAYSPDKGGFQAGYPCQLAYVGDIDITGFRRPLSYFREIVFGLRKDPYIAVQNPYKDPKRYLRTPWLMSDTVSSWTYDEIEGKPVVVEVYSPGDEVELILNGESLGRKAAGKEVGFVTKFEVPYQPGVLTAVAFQEGNEIGKVELATAGENRKIVLSAEDLETKALIYLPIEIHDDKGTLAADKVVKLEISVEGSAALVGFGSANPKSRYNYNGCVTETFNGRAQAILKKKGQGDVSVSVCSNDGKKAELNFRI